MFRNIGHEKRDELFHPIRGDSPKPFDSAAEQRVLKFSVYAALFFAVLGLIWGGVIGSQMIVFDAVYSFVSVVMAGLSIYVSKNLGVDDDVKFPFGRSQMEPMSIVFKSIAILVVCVYAFAKGMISLFSGGREINATSAMIYAVIGIVGCLAGWYHISKSKKKIGSSGLVKAEGMQWFMDAMLSAALFVAFFITAMMQKSGYVGLARYMDSLMTIIAAIFFAIVPVKTLLSGLKDMMLMTPDGEIYNTSKSALEEIARERGFQGLILRVSKRGRELFYEIGFVSENPEDTRSVGEFDSIRQEVEDCLGALFKNPKWLNISFMHDKKWG